MKYKINYQNYSPYEAMAKSGFSDTKHCIHTYRDDGMVPYNPFYGSSQAL
ncbi:hypothetical protein C900_03079 [Fulvivirga imtechensis AK7]|uniref:Uncharacterized protein n=1 Tax=Fulvivirga imtechensis AK7 TaxID=1237149 RepID=L8JQI1_9BACT|nr:hypothetical protein C900_03079 [Fulvivirga imtechensis AK7]